MKIYIAEFRYGSENIAELEVQERDKTYKVISKKDIIGRCWDRLIKKDDESVCLTLQEAFFKIVCYPYSNTFYVTKIQSSFNNFHV